LAPGDPRILIHPSEPTWLKVNGTAALIAGWLAEDGLSLDEASGRLAQQFDIALAQARQGVEHVHGELARTGMLSLAPEPPVVPPLDALFVNVTARCNLHCLHCFRGDADARCLDLDVAKGLVDQLAAAGGRSLTLCGGEPLLYPGIRELLDHVGRRLKVQVTTNATLLDREWAEFLASRVDPVVQISLEGAGPEIHDPVRGAGTFRRSLEAVGHLQAAGLGDRIVFSTTIMNQNREALREIVDLAGELGVPKVRFLILRKEGHAAESWQLTGEALDRARYEAFFEQILARPGSLPKGVDVSCGLSGYSLEPSLGDPGKRHWCDVGRMLAVDVDGEAYPCPLMMQGPFRLGNVHSATLAELHRSAPLAGLYATMATRHREAKGCSSCAWSSLCQGGCMALAQGERGSLAEPDGFCAYRKMAYARGFDRILGRVPAEG
jgi:radical SAM protein with 4Fe4S-binding SPASM domain